MGGNQVADFMVVGAGIAGASMAAELSRSGQVVVLEAEAHAGYHSTGRSAAVFSQHYGNAVVRALTRASREFLFRPPAEFAAVPLSIPRDGLYFARADQMEMLRQFHSDPVVQASTKMLSAAEVRERIPIFREGYIEAGLLDEGLADLDVDAIHQGFLRQARTRKAEVHFDCPVRELRRAEGAWTATTPKGDFRARVVVNAAGAWGDGIAALAGAAPAGLQPMRRTAVLVPVPRGLSADSWPAAVDIEEQFYFKPDAGLLMISPADEHLSVPCDVQPEELDVAIAIDRFEQAIDTPIRQIRRSWAGLRVFTADRTPVVGFDPDIEGFFWLVGQGGYGLQTAPAMARLAAALALKQSMPPDLLCFGVTPELLARERFNSSSNAPQR